MGRKLTAGVCVAALTLGSAAPAFAHDCMVAKKPAKAGAVGEYNFATNEFTPLKKNPGPEDKPHGAFVAFTDGDTISASTFIRAPQGVLPPTRQGGSQYNCDGKGLDALSVCFPESPSPHDDPAGGRRSASPSRRKPRAPEKAKA